MNEPHRSRPVVRRGSARRTGGSQDSPSLRQQILAVARELFAKEGYDSVSMRRIGSEAGCSAMAMYRYFASKEELLISICEETFAQLIHTRERAAKKEATPIERLRSVMRTFVRFGISHPNHYKLAFMTDIPPGPVADRKAAIALRGLEGLRERVKECVEGRSLPVDVELRVQMLRFSSQGMVASCILCPVDRSEQDRLLEHLIQVLTWDLE